MSLFIVRVEVDLVIEAEDMGRAEIEAQEYAADELRENESGVITHIEEIGHIAEVPNKWLNCCAWGGDGVKTIGETLFQ